MIRLKKISHKKGIRLGNEDGKNGSGKEAKVTKTADDIENQSVKQKVIDVFSIEEQDIIAHQAYRSMQQEAANSRMGFIFARVRTRDKANFRKKYFHNYYGPNLIKILFKTITMQNEQILRSRYHVDYPLNARDPLTNSVIVGEVEFYQIDPEELYNKIEKAAYYSTKLSEELDRQVQQAQQNMQICRQDTEEFTLNAHYIGTDYNYAT